MSTHIIYFHVVIRKLLCGYSLLSGAIMEAIITQWRDASGSGIFPFVCICVPPSHYHIYPVYLDNLTPYHINFILKF